MKVLISIIKNVSNNYNINNNNNINNQNYNIKSIYIN